jgi:antitoxin component of MazEF toxin-antitoxin module
MSSIEKLSKHGDRLLLAIDPALLQQLRIDENTPLEVSIEGQSLRISPVHEEQDPQRFEQVMASINERYAKTFKRLSEES